MCVLRAPSSFWLRDGCVFQVLFGRALSRSLTEHHGCDVETAEKWGKRANNIEWKPQSLRQTT